MSRQLDGRVAVVTGGGGGIGRATAESLARDGAAVVVVDLEQALIDETVNSLTEAGGRAVGHIADVSDAAANKSMIDLAVSTYGSLDILVNNAGVGGYTGGPMGEMEEELFDRLLAVNIKGVWLGMKHAFPLMREQGGGSIVNTASTLGLVGQRFSGPYSATKHAVIGLTKTAAIEYGLDNIRINAVCPGGVETPIAEKFRASMTQEQWDARNQAAFPATARYGKPVEIADVIAFLCSPAASNVHGVALPVDGGYTIQ